MQPLYIDPNNIAGTTKSGTTSTSYNWNTPTMSAPDTSVIGQATGGFTVPAGGSDGTSIKGGTLTGSGPAITAILPATTSFDPARQEAQQAAALAAQKAAEAGQLRGEITNIANRVKDIFNSRYSLVDQQGADTLSRLDLRDSTEQQNVLKQAEDANQSIGAGFAARGTADSSYRGNQQDIVTSDAGRQINEMGIASQEDRAKIGAAVAGQKSGFDAAKAGLDVIAQRIAEATDPTELRSIRDQLVQREQELQAGGSEYNTQQQNLSAISNLVPTNARAVQLKTTLSKIISSSALNPEMKLAMGTRVIQSSGLPTDEQDRLTMALQGDVGASRPQQQTTA